MMETTGRILEIFCGSWNMGNAPADGLDKFIPSMGGNFDLLAIGLQESQYKVDAASSSSSSSSAANKNTSNFLENMEKAFDPSIAHLAGQISSILGPDFYLVDHANRYQMQLLIFARMKLQKAIKNIEKTVENTGIMGVWPNKGGLCICLTVDSTKLAFISSHLAAHEGAKKCAVRNDHVREILGGVRAGDKRFDVTVQFHHTFFMGDMNYRLAVPGRSVALSSKGGDKTAGPSAPTEDDDDDDHPDDSRTRFQDQVYQAIAEGRWSELAQYDELCSEVNAGRVLPGFTSPIPAFPPTFKRVRGAGLPQAPAAGSGRAAGLSGRGTTPGAGVGGEVTVAQLKDYYDPKRLPAYTDRILYRSLPGFVDNLQLMSFESCEGAGSSDHKPVRCVFDLKTTAAEADIIKDAAHQGKLNMEFEVGELRGHDLAEMDVKVMGMGGGSDPYIIIHTDPPSILGEPVKSRTITHDLNPSWGEDKLRLKLNTHDVFGLARNAHLVISVWDYDRTNADDLIGVCCVPFSRLMGHLAGKYKRSSGKGMSFREPLLSNGATNGYLSGTISLVSAVANKSDTQMALSEYAAMFGGADRVPGQVPCTSQAQPHPWVQGQTVAPTPSALQAMRVEASLRDREPPSVVSVVVTADGLPRPPSTPPPLPTPPVKPTPPADDGAINPGARKLSLRIGGTDLVAREKKDMGQRDPLTDRSPPAVSRPQTPTSNGYAVVPPEEAKPAPPPMPKFPSPASPSAPQPQPKPANHAGAGAQSGGCCTLA
jgi:hypothetical protein